MPEVETVTQAVDAQNADSIPKDDPTAGNEFIVPGPKPTEKAAALNEKKLAKIVKEGGKRGVEIEGAADMGGLQFFCTMMGELTEGKVDLLLESMKAMNAISDPTEEERKGGAGKLGKMIFSFTEASISAVAYVPSNKSDECNAKEWLSEVIMNCSSKQACVDKIMDFEAEGIPAKNWAAVQIDADSANDIFPIKMRDPSISHAYNFLKKKGLFPEDDSEDEDDFVFGDEDFP